MSQENFEKVRGRMNVLHVVMNMDNASGVVTFVRRLVGEHREAGVLSDILTEADMMPEVLDADVVHIHGLWRPHFHRMLMKAWRQGVPVVWSPHGMLAPWSLKHKWLKKKIAWLLYQRADMKSASVIHVTSEQEAEWIRAKGLRQPVVLAPLGADLPELRKGVSRDSRVLLFVGRVYPVKAIDRLISAFALISADIRKSWRLRIVGPEEDAEYAASLRAQVEALGLCDCVELVGSKFGEELDAEYTNCSALALVSHTENFGATVVDAMAHGKPVITSTKTPWGIVGGDGERSRMGWWTDNDPSVLSRAIAEMMQLTDQERHNMGLQGRALVESRYTWVAVGRTMLAAYEKVIEGKESR